MIGPPVTEAPQATYEVSNLPSDQSYFLRYANARRINSTLVDHTNDAASGGTAADGSAYAERLNGSGNERYGLARSLSVMPGDVIRMEVYAKYIDANTANWTTALNTLMSQVASGNASVVVDGASYATSTSSFPYTSLLAHNDNGSGPKVYLNWLIFDKNYTFSNGGFVRLSNVPKESGQNVAHEKMVSPDITINEPGYMYIYLSNEEASPVEVYFDDFKVTQVHSTNVAGGDYYPFGLTMSDRELTAEPYRYGYQGQYSEENNQTGWNEFDLRMYDARTGRWISPDPYGQYVSPYLGMGNTPNMSVDVDGGWSWITAGIGFGVGATAGYIASDGDWRMALAGGIGGGALGGLAFNQKILPYNSFSRVQITPSKYTGLITNIFNGKIQGLESQKSILSIDEKELTAGPGPGSGQPGGGFIGVYVGNKVDPKSFDLDESGNSWHTSVAYWETFVFAEYRLFPRLSVQRYSVNLFFNQISIRIHNGNPSHQIIQNYFAGQFDKARLSVYRNIKSFRGNSQRAGQFFMNTLRNNINRDYRGAHVVNHSFKGVPTGYVKMKFGIMGLN